MRHLREIFRQKYELKRSHRQIARSVGVSSGSVAGAASRAKRWAWTGRRSRRLSDEALEERLYGPRGGKRRGAGALPDAAYLHVELRKPGVTLQLLHLEYLEQHANGYRYTAFCSALQRVACQAEPDDAPGASRRREALRRLLGEEAAHRRSGDGRGDGGRALRRGARGVELHVRGGDADAAGARLDREPRAGASSDSAGVPARWCPTSSRAA